MGRPTPTSGAGSGHGLFGPNNDTDLIAQDDDSGPNLLSRIRESLAAGTYFVRVRHFSSAQTGAYGIRVRRV